MNRNQRKYGKVTKKNDSSESGLRGFRSKQGVDDVEEVFPPRSLKKEIKAKPAKMHRSCYISPDQLETGQLTDERVVIEEYVYDSIDPDPITQLQELRKIICGSNHKVENSSQYTNPLSFVKTADGAQWQSVDKADDIDKFILQGKDEETLTQYLNLSKNIYIPEVPRVKIIAEKFSRYKEKNVELRKLDEKVVCVEYDVFDQTVNSSRPVQVMRAFFSIRPVYDAANENHLKEIPYIVKNKFNIAFEDLQKLSEREVEIIDSKIAENRPYLDDLRKVLRRNGIISKKDKKTIDLLTLYEIATMDYLNFEGNNTNYLSKEELHEVKDLILKKCKSSVHGISRRTVHKKEVDNTKAREITAISQSIVAELLREEGKSH